MSALLLDTHVLLWWLGDPRRLPTAISDQIADSESLVSVSAASLWEMAIKKAIGRLEMPANLMEVLREDSISVLDIRAQHALAVADLPRLHEDPFDRMLIVQARLEGLTLISSDHRLEQYSVPCIIF